MGAQPPTPEWGTMLAEAREFILQRLVGGDLARPRHPDHRARHQPDRRRPARRARPEAEAELSDGAARNRQPRRRLRDRRPARSAPSTGYRPRRSTPARCWRSSASPAPASRSPMLAVMGLLPPDGHGHRRRACASTAATCWRMIAARAAQDHRQGHGDDLPGADGEPQSLLHRRLPDRGGAARPHRPRHGRAPRPRHRAAERGRHPRAGASG